MAVAGAPTGRFAPSPTGPLHAGSLVAALASWLDARAHGGRWLVRIEDVDTPRCLPGMDAVILQQLATLRPACRTSRRCSSRSAAPAYAQALDALRAAGWAYPCGCSRSDIDAALAARGCAARAPRAGGLPRHLPRRAARQAGARRAPAHAARGHRAAHRLARPPPRRADAGRGSARSATSCCRRADGLWAYQLAVVVDDAWQQVTHVVRGEDLADNTRAADPAAARAGAADAELPAPPLVLGADGHKLSKQNGALALDLSDPLAALRGAARVLQLPPIEATQRDDWLAAAVRGLGGAMGGMMRGPQHYRTHRHDHHPFRPAVRRHRGRRRRHRARRPAGQRALHRLAARPERRRTAAAASSTAARTAASPSASASARARSSAAGTKACRA